MNQHVKEQLQYDNYTIMIYYCNINARTVNFAAVVADFSDVIVVAFTVEGVRCSRTLITTLQPEEAAQWCSALGACGSKQWLSTRLPYIATLHRLKIESHDGICNLSPVLKLGNLVIYPIVRFGLSARCFCTTLFRIQIRASGIAKALEGEVQQAAEKSMKPRSKKEDEARGTVVESEKIEHHYSFTYGGLPPKMVVSQNGPYISF